jgi:hypothetical protein
MVCYDRWTMAAEKFRVLAAVVCSALAVGFYGSNRELNVQNVLMGVAALVSLAAIVVPSMRQHAPSADSQAKATHHSA